MFFKDFVSVKRQKIKRGASQTYDTPSSTSHPDPLTLRGEGGNRPTRCSEPLRSKDGGPKRSSPNCAGWDRRGTTCYNLLVETTIFVPHCSIALRLSPLEWGYFLTFCLLQARNKIICCMFCYNIDRKPTLS